MTGPDWWDPDWWDEARRIARHVARQQRSRYLPAGEYEAAALGAIALRAAELGRVLTRREMNQVGHRAAAQEANKAMSQHGVARSRGNGERFLMHWLGGPRTASPFEERVLERLAVWQVWWALDQRTRDILIAYITAETPAGRARLAGCADSSFDTFLRLARKRARQLWHDHETDPGMWRAGGRRRFAA